MGSAIRFTGLSSGLDTQSVVEALLTSYQSKIDTQTANKTKAEWKKEIYTDLNSKLKTFKSSLTSLKSAADLCKTKTTTSQDGVISVNTSSYSGDENHTVLVKQVATKASVQTMVMNSYTDENGEENKVTSTTELSELFGGSDVAARNAVLTIGQATVDLKECTTIGDIVNAVKEQDDNIDISFDDSISAFIISSKNTGKSNSISLGTATRETAANGNVTYTEATLTDQSDAYSAFAALGIGYTAITDVSGHTRREFNAQYDGQNAIIQYNNSVTFESETNDIEVNGLSFTVQNTSERAVNVSITQDTDQLLEKVKTFIESYNTLLGEITTKYYAESASDYDVLTDDEKESMSEKEIEDWENKIKSSLLRRDSTLKSLYSALRDTMSTDYSDEKNLNTWNTKVNEERGLLALIGIKSSDWTAQGKLTITEEELKQAIETDGGSVATLISNLATDLEKKLGDLSSTTDNLKSYGSYFNDKVLTEKISSYEDAIDKAQDRYDVMEEYYYTKFTAMEKAMNELNSSSSLFSNM